MAVIIEDIVVRHHHGRGAVVVTTMFLGMAVIVETMLHGGVDHEDEDGAREMRGGASGSGDYGMHAWGQRRRRR
jgi:hypothetical protein